MKRQAEAPRHWTRAKRTQRAVGVDKMLGPGGVRGSNVYTSDETLRALLKHHGASILHQFEEQFTDFGAWVGAAVDSQAEYTDSLAPPRLETYDRNGDLVNRISHNPHYVACSRELYRRGFLANSFGPKRAPFITGFTYSYLLAQADLSLQLSATLSGAVAYVLASHAPSELRRVWLPGMLRSDGTALIAATWTSERGGNDDPGRITTEARKSGAEFTLHGLKWFASSAECDFALVTARPDPTRTGTDGVGLYLVPRRLSNGNLNPFHIRRIKKKIGTRGLVTAEVDLNGAVGYQVTAPGSGLKALYDAMSYARVHNAMAGVAIQRRALLESIDHTSKRGSLGRTLTTCAASQDALLTLRSEYDADIGLAFAAATQFDEALRNPEQTAWLRLLTVLAKYRSGLNAANASAVCMELYGGDGYVEDFVCARLHRDALALKVWEAPAAALARDLVGLMSNRFDIKQRFGRTVRGVIDNAPLKASRLAGGLRRGLAEYEEAARYLQHFPEAGERLGVRLLGFMADLYAGALLLQDAGRDIEAGDARKAVMLDGYLRRYFPEQSTLLAVRTSECLKMFERLVTGSPIPVDSEWEKGLRNGL